jgi:hypothetical protein
MFRSRRFLLGLFAITLINASLQGCAQDVFSSRQKGYTKGDDCLFCHAGREAGGNDLRDFTPIYDNPASHHPVGMEYPLGPYSNPEFNQPTGYSEGTIFFDDDNNGEMDLNEIRLFGKGNAVKVECGSCHREHGESSTSTKDASNHYLRVPNGGSSLCLICHQK